MNNPRFEERQQFRQKWAYLIYLLLGASVGVFIYADIQQIILARPFGDKPAPDIVLLLITISLLAMILLFYYSRLETVITQEYVSFRWAPFRRSFRQINWSNVSRAEVIKYGFVGYGLRFTRYGTVYNVTGNIGLQLTLKSGRKIVIGTQKESELSSFLKQIKIN